MIDKTKRYRTPSGEIVTGAELVEVPPVRTAEDIVEDVYARWRRGDGERGSLAECAVAALREAGYDLDSPKAQPDPDGWIEHDGGPCPVDGDTRVQVRFDTGTGPCEAKAHAWHWNCVTHYRLVGE